MWEIFEKLCQERGVTPYRVSEATGIKTSALSGWKHGRFKFKQDKLKKIADYFGVSVEYLMTGEEEGYYVNPETAEMAQKITECQPESAELQSTVLCGVLCTALKKLP